MLNFVSGQIKLIMSQPFELLVAVIGLLLCLVSLFIFLFQLYYFYGGTPIFKSAKIGHARIFFIIYKFWTMLVDKPLVTGDDLKKHRLYSFATWPSITNLYC